MVENEWLWLGWQIYRKPARRVGQWKWKGGACLPCISNWKIKQIRSFIWSSGLDWSPAWGLSLPPSFIAARWETCSTDIFFSLSKAEISNFACLLIDYVLCCRGLSLAYWNVGDKSSFSGQFSSWVVKRWTWDLYIYKVLNITLLRTQKEHIMTKLSTVISVTC